MTDSPDLAAAKRLLDVAKGDSPGRSLVEQATASPPGAARCSSSWSSGPSPAAQPASEWNRPCCSAPRRVFDNLLCIETLGSS
jgi:hypothetical protein